MKKKTLVYACDHAYFKYTKASFASFCEHHSLSEWQVIFADVGLHQWQKAELSCFGEVVQYEPCHHKQMNGFIFTAARARIKILTDFIRDDTVLLYLDSDTLIFDNLDNLVSVFVDSGKTIAILLEDIDEFWRTPASYGWRDAKIPEEFQNQDKWRGEPMANTGVLLAQGVGARKLGEISMSLYEKHGNLFRLGEQTIIASLLYEREIPFMKLTPRYHCLVWEKHITHIGEGFKYVATQPFFRGERVAIRHFAGSNRVCKIALNKALPLLGTNERLLKISKKNDSHL
jgi:lipopolysaccharide biosynthesis glycosyltransferase